MILFTKKRTLFVALFTLFSFLCCWETLNAQTNQCPSCWVSIVRHRLVTNVNISPNMHGYGELLPQNYNPGSSTKHPLIIHMHGRGGTGPGNDPYWICMAICDGLPPKLESGLTNDTYVVNGQTYSFIVLTPNYTQAGNWSDIGAFIDYAIATYPKVDRSRIYLAGLSMGSSMIMDYMSSSSANARKVAAVVPVAGCNSQNSNGVNNIVANNVHYWGLTAVEDNVCYPGNTINWANAIIGASQPNNILGKLSITPVYNPAFNHDIAKVWESSWTDGGTTILRWMLNYQSAAGGSLPATLGNYNVTSKNKQVVAEWTTTLESNTDYFFIERAASDMQFKQIGRVTAAGNSTIPQTYSFSDPQPLKGNSFYRLGLMNRDGIVEYYDIKKIITREFGVSLSLSPVPVSKTLQLSFELEQTQKLNITIRDINGRTMKSWSGNFSSGYGSFPINVEALAPGVYHLAVQGSSFTETKKFIKQ